MDDFISYLFSAKKYKHFKSLLILKFYLVGARGFEPPTSCSQSRRAARLRHAPIVFLLRTISCFLSPFKRIKIIFYILPLAVDHGMRILFNVNRIFFFLYQLEEDNMVAYSADEESTDMINNS